MQAMVTKMDRDERGVGMQNFRYAPDWDELCHVIQIHSPQAYRTLREQFPARSQRDFRYVHVHYQPSSIVSNDTHLNKVVGKRVSLDFQWKFVIGHLSLLPRI